MNLQSSLKQFFGFDAFKGRQEAIIQSILEGRDTFVIMPTGGGKSMCYQLPALLSEGTAIVISPLIALMKNQVDAVRGMTTDQGIAHVLNSSLSKSEATKVKQDIVDGRTKLLFVAPESLTKAENISFFKQIKVSFVAVDEAHCISEWGHDFRPEYRRIKDMIGAIDENIAVIALTATATPKVQQDIQKNLGMTDAAVFKDSFNRSNLFYEVRPKENAAREIIRFVKGQAGKSGIIYCLSRKKVEELAQVLQVNGINALPYHAGMDAATRAKNQDMFLMEEVEIIVATIAFGMGIDKPDVRFVIHHDMPKSLEGYYQETGRAGRDGGEGVCLSFYSYKDIEKLEKFLQGKPVAEQEIGRQLIMETIAFAETSLCRRKYLLHYFGESFPSDECGEMCDNCKNPKEKIEGGAEVKLLLEAVVAAGEKLKGRHVVDILTGHESPAVKTYKHHKLPMFGKGKGQGDKFWSAAIRQSYVAGFITKSVEEYGVLKVSEAGRAFIQNPTPFDLVMDHNYDDIKEDDGSIINEKSGSAADTDLLSQLKDLRKKISKDKGLPPFVIFQDPSLEDMATQYPINKEELCNIVGVGQGKAMKFGKPFIQHIAQYVEENDIDRPQDMVVKSVVNKSGQKVYIIQGIDRKMKFDDMAASRSMKVPDLITEIEHIVESGTKVNIDYYINEILDFDQQEEVFDYFAEAETDDVGEAVSEFDEEYTEEEIRLMRIKFLSEVGN